MSKRLYDVGKKLIYPGRGLVRVVKLVTHKVGDASKAFYILEDSDNLSHMVPQDDAALTALGVREVVSANEANRVITFLQTGSVKVDKTTWNRRYLEFMEDIRSGDLMTIAKVHKKLKRLKSDTDLSFGERKMLDLTTELIATELAQVVDFDVPFITHMLREVK